jgi:hypothetical protein
MCGAEMETVCRRNGQISSDEFIERMAPFEKKGNFIDKFPIRNDAQVHSLGQQLLVQLD